MRGTVPGLANAQPIVELMPAVYQEDQFTGRFTAGLDDTFAPILAVIDCIDAYVDPALAPEDFVDWLAGWVGMPQDDDTSLERRRAGVEHAVELYRMRGTLTGLRAHLELVSGGEVALADNGGVVWSTTPGTALPGEGTPRLGVRIRLEDPGRAPLGLLNAVVSAGKPAHVVHRLEVEGT
ncbi:MAG TPA: phage tail protein [Mycobacteriales bacterium]|nr:phage tail protein [Mycobacteriales bacterium]